MRSAGSSSVRVATLNLWGRQGAWEARRSVLVDGLRTLRADLVAFQEAITGEGYDQVEDVLVAPATTSSTKAWDCWATATTAPR